MKDGLTRLSLAEAAERVRHGRVSPVELTEACLRQIRRYNHLLNSFITVTAETVLRPCGPNTRFGVAAGVARHGIPVALKATSINRLADS